MQLKMTTDYAIRMMLYLAMQKKVCSAQEISKNTGIERDYLVQVAKSLRNAKLIQSVRGAQGGYELTRDPQDIMLSDIVEALEGVARMQPYAEQKQLHELDASVVFSMRASYEAIRANLERVFDISLDEVLYSKGLTESSNSVREASMPIVEMSNGARKEEACLNGV